MAYTYEELKHKTVAELRQIAAGLDYEAVRGYTQLNKEHLLAMLCNVIGVNMHAHHTAKAADKAELKSELRELKKQRDEAIAAHDHERLKAVRRRRHELNHRIRHAAL